ISEGGAARGLTFQNAGTGALRDVREFAAKIAIQDGVIPVMNIDSQAIHFRKGMPVHQKEILQPVVVEIEEAAAPANIPRVAGQPCWKRHIVELAAAAIAIQRLALVGEISAEDVG